MKKLTSFILSVLLCASMLAAPPQAFCCNGTGASSAGAGIMTPVEPGETDPPAAPGREDEPEEPLRPNAPGGKNELF